MGPRVGPLIWVILVGRRAGCAIHDSGSVRGPPRQNRGGRWLGAAEPLVGDAHKPTDGNLHVPHGVADDDKSARSPRGAMAVDHARRSARPNTKLLQMTNNMPALAPLPELEGPQYSSISACHVVDFSKKAFIAELMHVTPERWIPVGEESDGCGRAPYHGSRLMVDEAIEIVLIRAARIAPNQNGFYHHILGI